jgi:hypothetical protein
VRIARPRLAAALAAILLTVPLAAACSASAPDPSSPCNGADEQSAAGFYPDLEAMLPTHVGGRGVTNLRSGRYCSAKTLGLLATKTGISELRFAGEALPDPTNANAGLALIVYHAPGLTLDALADAQAAGAGTSQGVGAVTANRATIAGRSGIRIDATVQSGQEMLFFWPAAQAGTFDAVTAIGETDAQVAEAVAAFGQPRGGSAAPGTARAVSPEPSSP